MANFEIRPTNDLREVAKELRTVADGKALRKQLTGGIRGVLRPLVPVVRAAYLAGPSGRGNATRQGGGLRRQLARSVRVEVRTGGKFAGARIRADGRRMPDGMKALPAYWEGERGRWRHPVFGNRDNWVAQAPHPTFYRTLEPHTDSAGHAIDRVLYDVKQKIEAQR
jgi:hypothetical protein